MMKGRYFEGIRILDLTMWWSGPLTTSYFGALGAEVIKIESVQAPDGFRYTSVKPMEKWWEKGPQWNAANLNKKGLTLNLRDEKGVEVFKELVKQADVIIENFTAKVMKNFGLTYEKLKEINPEIIMVSMPAYGSTGPMKNSPGFAYTFEILSGIAQVNGYENDNPLIISGVGDVTSGFHTIYSILAALEYRERTGEGQFIEIAQVETSIVLLGQPLADLSMNQRVWGRIGNKHPGMAPHGIFRSKGDDSWIAIAITNDEEWQRFCEVISRPDLMNDERYSTIENRYENQDELTSIIEDWTTQYTHYEATEILQQHGIKSGPALEVEEMEHDPYLGNMFQEISRELTGTHLFPSWPVKYDGERLLHQCPAPTLGQHNEEILKELLNYTDEQISELEEADIIGTVPLNATENL